MSKYNLNKVANEQAELLEKIQELPVTDTSQVILNLLSIQVIMAHIIADIIDRKY